MSKIVFTKGLAPDAASPDTMQLYAKTDGILYMKDDLGIERPFGTPTNGDMLSQLFHAEVVLTGDTVLDTSACGKMHYCNHSLNLIFSLLLPDPATCANKFIGLRAESQTINQAVIVTSAGASTALEAINSPRVMTNNESAILYSTGSYWTRVGGKSYPVSMQGANGSVSVTDGTSTIVSNSAVQYISNGAWSSVTGGGPAMAKPRSQYRLTVIATVTVGPNALARIALAIRSNGNTTLVTHTHLPGAMINAVAVCSTTMVYTAPTTCSPLSPFVVEGAITLTSVTGTNTRSVAITTLVEEISGW